MAAPDLSIPPLSSGDSLAEQVRDALLTAINSGALPPGTRLREIPLSEHFGLSKTPVREALRLLESDGVVRVTPRRGAVVTSLDADAVRNLYDFRLILEVAAARGAAESTEPTDRLTALYEEMDSSLDADYQSTFHRLDLELHRTISDMTGNPELTDAITRVHQRIHAARVRSAVIARIRTAHRQHGLIIAAIGDRDADAAGAEMAEHIESAREHVLGFLAETG